MEINKRSVPVSRRRLLLLGTGIGALGLAAIAGCTDDQVVTETKIQTVIVEKIVEVPAASVGPSDEELVYVDSRVFEGLDPVHDFSSYFMMRVAVAESLLKVTPDGTIAPWLAESFKALDARTWEVKLRDGVTFWSGRSVDAEAVKASMERQLALAPQAEGLLKGITIRVVDALTLHFEGEGPIPGLPFNLTDRWLVIHNGDSFGPSDNSFDVSAMDLTGPYRVIEFKPKESVILERVESYWGEKPQFERIRYLAIVQSEARTLMALSGEADIVVFLPPTAASLIEASDKVDLIRTQRTSVGSIYLNFNREPLDDIRVRQAIGWGINRDDIIELGLGGLGRPVGSHLAPNPFYPEAANVGFTKYDPDRAAQLLDDAGWLAGPDGMRQKDGVPLFMRNLWSFSRKAIAEVIQENLGKIGFKVEVIGSEDPGLLQQTRKSGDWDSFVEAWGTFGDPFDPVNRHFGATGDLNYNGYNNPEVSELFASFADAADLEARRQLALKINVLVARDAPIAALYSQVNLVAISRTIEGWQPTAETGRGPDITASVRRKR